MQVLPNATWNYGLLVGSLSFVGGGAVPRPHPFDAWAAAPVRVRAKARVVPEWTAAGGARGVAAVPKFPLESAEALVDVELVSQESPTERRA